MEYSASNTIGWQKARVFIDCCVVSTEVMENGILKGYLADITVRWNGLQISQKIHPLAGITNIFKYFIPIAHIHSFGKYTQLILLYNPNKPSEVIIDPNQIPWHFEI